MTTADAGPQTRNWVPDASAFGARLALIRQRMGWGNVKEAAEACSLPVESWRNWERDNREPRNYVEVCRTIASATGVDLMWLITGEQHGASNLISAPAVPLPRPNTGSCRRSGMRTRTALIVRHPVAVS